MKSNTLFDRCRTNTNIDSDVFVGIKRKDECYEVNFPLGFHQSDDEKGLRKDIILLLNVLSKHTDKRESEIRNGLKIQETTRMPVRAYLYVIRDFYERGYYKERETYRSVGKRGKIDWGRTIKTQKPVIQEDEVYYLDYVIKRNTINEDELITIIHKYCVYESFDKFGWLFTSFVPPSPRVGMNRKMMVSVVNDKLQNTYNDRNKQLFKNMIAILASAQNDSESEFEYGTNRFEYIWESMIDRVFGINEKEEYFPRTTWNLIDGGSHNNAFLEPDSIMLVNGKVYVLDAKYYKYGWSGAPGHLPESTSINKQITYGEYIAEDEKFAKDGKNPIVYNAFIMPYDSKGRRFPTGKPMYYIGTAGSDWKKGKKEYENVVGILMDVKYLMGIDSMMEQVEMQKLSQIIDKYGSV